MDHDELASMCVEIVGGVKKENSRYVVDAETAKDWDELAADVAKIRRDHPGMIIDIPHEIA